MEQGKSEEGAIYGVLISHIISWTLHIFPQAVFVTSSSTLRGRPVSVVREKAVSLSGISSSCDALSSIATCFDQTNLATGCATCRGTSVDAWAQDRRGSSASGRIARGKPFQSLPSCPGSCSLVSSSDQSHPGAAARSDGCPARGTSRESD
jgi:hypothetical protein